MSKRLLTACTRTAALLVGGFLGQAEAQPSTPQCPAGASFSVHEDATGCLIFGVGVNSDAGLTGSIVFNERNFDTTRRSKKAVTQGSCCRERISESGADEVLFLAASFRFFRKEYKQADFLYGQLAETYEKSPFVEQALKLAIISKQLSAGGGTYDVRKAAEGRRLIERTLESPPANAKEGTNR